jgi:hypothetical protein
MLALVIIALMSPAFVQINLALQSGETDYFLIANAHASHAF